MRIYGYELLYRQGLQNSFSSTGGIDDDIATAEVLYNSFFVVGINDLTDGTKAFINFSKALMDSDVPLMLPKEKVIVEVLEREKATPATLAACARIRSLGYQLALDDFVFDEDNLPLLGYTDIIKVEYPSMDLSQQAALLKKYHGKIKFLAEKIETREEYQKAKELGYHYFQGYFFSKPAMINSKEILTLNTTLFSVIEELNAQEPDLKIIAELITGDLGLSYKLLKLANSVYVGAKSKIKTITQALTTLGIRELYQWISLMMIKDMQNIENAETIKQSLVRGKFMSMLAEEIGRPENTSEYFFTGSFSMIDILLNRSMGEILAGLPLTEEVKEALLGAENDLKEMLDLIISFEKAEWDTLQQSALLNAISADRFMYLYVNAVKWASQLKY
ncbi:MAG: EAL and HDOD domain-containing protein [Intestinibacillus sp.]